MAKRNSPRKVFIETSVFIRFLTNDDPKKALNCLRLFEMVEHGALRPYTSNIVILEIIYVLERLYRFPRTDVSDAIEKILALRNLTLIEKTDTRHALDQWRKQKAKYGDCLIATQLPQDILLLSYDGDFKSFELNTATPADIAKQ